MSWRATAWVKLCRLGSVYRKAVLLVVADFASDKLGPDGGTVPEGHAVCWAGLAEVAAAAEVDERTVRRVLRDMEAATVVLRERRHDRQGHRTTDAIWIHYGRMPVCLGDIAESTRDSPVDDSPTGLPGTRLPDSQVPPTGLSYVPAEPSVNNLGNQEDHLLYATTGRARARGRRRRRTRLCRREPRAAAPTRPRSRADRGRARRPARRPRLPDLGDHSGRHRPRAEEERVTMTAAYRPTDLQIRHYWAMLRGIVAHFLGETERECGPDVAADIADCFRGRGGADGTWCIRARCNLDDDDVPDPDSLVFMVYVRPTDEWQPFAEARWHVLVPREWADYQVQTLALAHGLGIPESPAELFTPDPPPQPEA